MITIKQFHCNTALFFNRLVNEIFGNLFYQTFGRKRYFLQNRHLKPKIDCKNKSKWKLLTCFSRNYNFAFTNLFKMRQNGLQCFKIEKKSKDQFSTVENMTG
jgi:hypothetical protein